MVITVYDLPPSDSPKLTLSHPTPAEKLATWHLNGEIWRGAMDMPTYVRREQYLENQAFTRDGGITFWILVDAKDPPDARPILSSCETLRKRALIAAGDGGVKDVISHGVGSVFCNPEYRGKGYAQRMTKELGKRLDDWKQEEGASTNFTVLYSDIGKKFYSQQGWEPFSSSHIALPPAKDLRGYLQPQPLYAKDLAELCNLDEQWLREEVGKPELFGSEIRVALVPDVVTMQWHHAREEFAGKELLKREPDIKGAYFKSISGNRAWCIWTRTFGSTEAANTLHILRFVIEGEKVVRKAHTDEDLMADYSNLPPSDQERIQACAVVLRAAQVEAANWKMTDVQFWNPTPVAILAAREIQPSSQVLQRDEESIASLRWHGLKSEDRGKVEWVGNEKFGWC